MSFLKRLFGNGKADAPTAALYAAVVAEARQPVWYLEAKVPDTIDGRFEMIATILSLALLRLEREGAACGIESAALTETFVSDMDGQLREIGIGDVVVGKHIGKMMSALGGRLGAMRDGLASGGDLATALARNLYRGTAPDTGALELAAERIRGLHAALTGYPAQALLAGDWPKR